MTAEELAIIAQLVGGGKTLSDFQAQPTPAAPAAPSPYATQAAKYNTEADTLDKQAATPYPQPQGAKEQTVSALRAAMENFGRLGAPGGYYGQEEQRQKSFTDANDKRVAQAKALRGEAAQQQQLGQQKDFQTGELANQAGNLKVNQDAEARLQKQSNRPVIDNNSPGTSSFARDPNNQMKPIEGTTVTTPAKEPTQKAWHYQELNIGGKNEVWAVDPDTGIKDHKVGDAQQSAGGANGGMQIIQSTENGKAVYARAKVAGPEGPIKFDGKSVENATAGNAGARAGVAATVDVATADKMLSVMQDTYNRLQSGQSKAPGADDMVLLSNHIAMTFGGVKGARTGRDMIEAHLKARSLPDSLAAAAERVLNGGQLTPGQREEFLNLAKSNVSAMHQKQMDLQDSFGGTPAAPAAGGFIKPGGALESLLKGGK